MADQPGTPTILIIDDDITILDIASETLQSSGFLVHTADNGYAGLRIFAEQAGSIELVLLDWNMPGMDGMAVYNAIRQISATVPVVFSSGYSAQILAEQIHTSPPPAFLQKPYQLHELIALVRELTRKA